MRIQEKMLQLFEQVFNIIGNMGIVDMLLV